VEPLDVAAELCRLVDQPDLLSWLGVPSDASPDEARAALKKQRSRMQGMQHNPKFKESAKFLIKNFRKLDELLGDVGGYLRALRAEEVESQLPLLQLAIDSVLADGILTREEEQFVREQAANLGIATELYERILIERCEAAGIDIPTLAPEAPPAPFSTIGPSTGEFKMPKAVQRAHRMAGSGWWDDRLTDLLLDHIPIDTKRVIDLACGLGWAALTLLPRRPSLEYLGVDTNKLSVELSLRNVSQAGLAARAIVQRHDPRRLPIPDGAVDVVLCIMSLQGKRDTRPLFAEAARLLRPGGRMIVVEPDCLAQSFWFDGTLRTFNESFTALCERADEVLADLSGTEDPDGQPGIALGPRLPHRLELAGLDPRDVDIHAVQVAQRSSFEAFAKRLRQRADAMRQAAALPATDPLFRAVTDSLEALLASRDPEERGLGAHLLPLFVVVGHKPEQA
jgi:SAM-dependent methyltransferase